jgi:hypothetical protein
MTARILAPRGAYVMGRNMYAPDRGECGSPEIVEVPYAASRLRAAVS